MQEQRPPEQQAKTEKPQKLAIIRKGMRVFVGEPKGVGLWITTSSAPLARAAEAGLKARLMIEAEAWISAVTSLLRGLHECRESTVPHGMVRLTYPDGRVELMPAGAL